LADQIKIVVCSAIQTGLVRCPSVWIPQQVFSHKDVLARRQNWNVRKTAK